MSGTCYSIARHVIGPGTLIELSRTSSRNGPPFSLRISASNKNGVEARPEGPSCIFVGPIETANKETLEALYRQARDAYYSGRPLIVDDMFDKVELKLRWYGSKYVIKYPRCSLRQQSTYADAEEDQSQVFALASVWLVILGFGCLVAIVPIAYTLFQAYKDEFNSEILYASQESKLKLLTVISGIFYILLGSIIGYPIASASGFTKKPISDPSLVILCTIDGQTNIEPYTVGALQGLFKNDLVALKGTCPNCGEEVFAFVRSGHSNQSPHKADCHVCQSSLEFRTKVERSVSEGRQWVHGRIYLIRKRGRSKRWA
ncbi:hypothetical protein Leryth_009532 [Lithospermum erythrorhizon]|nr:hypothetical protein Leryth_009532 [Lithospermum erythrorhizon]